MRIKYGGVWGGIFVLLLVLLTAGAFAQVNAGGATKPGYNIKGGKPVDRYAIETLMDDSLVPAEVTMSRSGKIAGEVRGKFSIDTSKPLEEACLDFIDRHRDAFGLKDPKSELKLSRKDIDTSGRIHLLFQQMYNGIPIENSGVGVNLDNGKNIYLIYGGKVTPNIDTTPLLTADEAIKIATDRLNKAAGGTAHLNTKIFKPRAELVIYPLSESSFELAYYVKVSASKPLGDWFYYFDAKDGHLITMGNNLRYEGTISGSGVMWNQSTVSVNLWQTTNGNIYLVDSSKSMGHVTQSNFVFANSTALDNGATFNNFTSNGSISAWNANV